MSSTERDINFTVGESEKLKHLIQKYTIVLSKKTDHASTHQKELAWKKLTNEFNQDSIHYRSTKQLQNKFNNLKRKARNEMAIHKKNIRETGGGPPAPTPSPSTEWLSCIFKESISERPAIYDSDSIPGCNAIEPSDRVTNMEDNTLQSDLNTTEPSNEVTNMQDKTSQSVASKKRKLYRYTPQETLKSIISLSNKKAELVKAKMQRETVLNEFVKKEHEEILNNKKILFELDIKHKNDLQTIKLEKAALELDIEKKKLEKASIELEIEKHKLKVLKGYFSCLIFSPCVSTSRLPKHCILT